MKIACLKETRAHERRDLCGVLLGNLAGIGAGLLLCLSPLLNRLLLPLLTAVRQVALFLWIAFLSIWVGDGETAKIAFVGLAAFFPVMLNTERGIASVDRGLMEVADLLRLPYRVRLWRILLPQAVPSIAAGPHLALIYGLLATIGSEYLPLSGAGIGTAMITARQLLQMDQVIVGIVAIAAIGFLQHVMAGWIETRLLGWTRRRVDHFGRGQNLLRLASGVQERGELHPSSHKPRLRAYVRDPVRARRRPDRHPGHGAPLCAGTASAERAGVGPHGPFPA